jgi:hypothetical protein
MNRIAVLALAASLAGCATVSSQKPVFAPAPDKTALAGVYEMHGDKGEITLLVRRHDAASYEAYLYNPEAPFQQGLAAEFNAVPMGHGDYVLQVGCLATRKDDEGGRWETAPPGFQYWTLTAARAHDDYWLGFVLTDAAADALTAKYHQPRDKDGIKLTALSPQTAQSFFADWAQMQMSEGGDHVFPVEKKLDWDKPSDAPQFDHPRTCREIAKSAG